MLGSDIGILNVNHPGTTKVFTEYGFEGVAHIPAEDLKVLLLGFFSQG